MVALWWTIYRYRIPITYMNNTYDWLLVHVIYTKADVCAYIHNFTMTTAHNILLLLTKKEKQEKARDVICTVHYTYV